MYLNFLGTSQACARLECAKECSGLTCAFNVGEKPLERASSQVGFVLRIRRNLTKPRAGVTGRPPRDPEPRQPFCPCFFDELLWPPMTSPSRTLICLFLSLCFLYLSLHVPPCLHLSACLSLSLAVWLCGWVAVYMNVYFPCVCISMVFLSFFSLCVFRSICVLPSVPVSLWLHHLLLLRLTGSFPSLSALCANDQTAPIHLYTIFQVRGWPPTLNSNSTFLEERIWLAQLGAGVNFWFNSTVARKAWSKGREVSGAIKMIVCYWSTEHSGSGQWKIKRGKRTLEKKKKLLTIWKYYKHLTRNTSRIKQH